jgi:hypothetical protein
MAEKGETGNKFIKKHGPIIIFLLIINSIYFLVSAFLYFSLLIDLMFLLVLGFIIGLVLYNDYKWLKLSKLKNRLLLTQKKVLKSDKNFKRTKIWIFNRPSLYTLILGIISVIPYPFVIIRIWDTTKELDYVVGISAVYLILPFTLFGVFMNSPFYIGFSKRGLYGKYIRKLKNIGHFRTFNEDVVKYFKEIKWEEITQITKKEFNEEINRILPFSSVIFIHTKSGYFYAIDLISMELLIEIYNHFMYYKKLGNKYNPNKIKIQKYNFKDIPQIIYYDIEK